PLRPHLLQPGPDVGCGHSPGRDRDGFLHRRRGLCACHVGSEHHRAQPRHDLSRRAAAGEGGNRRGGERGRSGGRRRPQPPVRRHRLLPPPPPPPPPPRPPPPP